MKMINVASSVLLLATLSGCNGERDTNRPPSSLKVTERAFTTVTPYINERVSLTPYILSSPGRDEQLSISKLTLLNSISENTSCETPEVEQLAIGLQIDNAVCEYQYTLTDSSTGESAEGKLIVTASTSDEPLLAPLSSAQMVGEVTSTKVTVPEGYELVSEYVLYGEGTVNVDLSGTIEFRADSVGVHQILYALSDKNSGDTLTGQIDVAVNDNDDEEEIKAEQGVFYKFEEYEISVDTTPYVTSSSDYILLDAKSLTATVDISSVNQKVIDIKLPNDRDHWVTYIAATRGAVTVGSFNLCGKLGTTCHHTEWLPEHTLAKGQTTTIDLEGYTDATSIAEAWYGEEKLTIDQTTPLKVTFTESSRTSPNSRSIDLRLKLRSEKLLDTWVTPNIYVPKGLDILETDEAWWSFPPSNDDIYKFRKQNFIRCFPTTEIQGHNDVVPMAQHLPDYTDACININTDSEGNPKHELDINRHSMEGYCQELNDIVPAPGTPWEAYNAYVDDQNLEQLLLKELKNNFNIAFPFKNIENGRRTNNGLCTKTSGKTSCGGNNKHEGHSWYGQVLWHLSRNPTVDHLLNAMTFETESSGNSYERPIEGYNQIYSTEQNGKLFDQTVQPMCVSKK